MAGDTGDRMKVVIGYAVWATLCAAAAGVAVSLLLTAFFSYHAGPHDFWRVLFDDVAIALAIAAGQGAVALALASQRSARVACSRAPRASSTRATRSASSRSVVAASA